MTLGNPFVPKRLLDPLTHSHPLIHLTILFNWEVLERSEVPTIFFFFFPCHKVKLFVGQPALFTNFSESVSYLSLSLCSPLPLLLLGGMEKSEHTVSRCGQPATGHWLALFPVPLHLLCNRFLPVPLILSHWIPLPHCSHIIPSLFPLLLRAI